MKELAKQTKHGEELLPSSSEGGDSKLIPSSTEGGDSDLIPASSEDGKVGNQRVPGPTAQTDLLRWEQMYLVYKTGWKETPISHL